MGEYIKAEMEVTEFETEDVITTSGISSDPDGGFGWEEEDPEPW